MNEKHEHQLFYILSIILNLISIMLSSVLFLAMGLLMLVFAREKELDYQKS